MYIRRETIICETYINVPMEIEKNYSQSSIIMILKMGLDKCIKHSADGKRDISYLKSSVKTLFMRIKYMYVQ